MHLDHLRLVNYEVSHYLAHKSLLISLIVWLYLHVMAVGGAPATNLPTDLSSEPRFCYQFPGFYPALLHLVNSLGDGQALAKIDAMFRQGFVTPIAAHRVLNKCG